MLIRLSASLLGLVWIPLGAITIIVGILTFVWFRLPCDLGQATCTAIEDVIVKRALFGQVYREDVLTAVLLCCVIALLFGVLWMVSGLNLVRHGIAHQAPHAPDYGVKLVLLTVGALLFVNLLLDQTARPWLGQQQITFASLAENPAPPPENTAPLIDPQWALALINTYNQALTTTQTVNTATAMVIGLLGLLLWVSPYPNQTDLHTEQHQCETCGLVGDIERPRCILCHAPLALAIPPDTLNAASGQKMAVRLTLQPEVNNGLPVRRPELYLSMPRRFNFSAITSDGVGKWEYRATRFGRRNIIKGPAYLSRPVTLTIELGVAPRFQLFHTRMHSIAVKALASQSTTASGQIRVRVARTKLIDRIPARLKMMPRNLAVILANLVKAARNLIRWGWHGIRFVSLAIYKVILWLIAFARNWRTAGQFIRTTGQRLGEGFKSGRQKAQIAVSAIQTWVQNRQAAPKPVQPTASPTPDSLSATVADEEIKLSALSDEPEVNTFAAFTDTDDNNETNDQKPTKPQGLG